MQTCRIVFCFCFLLILSDLRSLGATPQVEVIAKTAKVKVNQETIAVVEKGQRYRLLKTQGAWAAILVGEGENAKRGWVLASAVRLLPDPAITEESAAPAEPLDVRVSIDMTQFSGWGAQTVLYFKVRIGNESSDPIDVKTTDLELKVDEKSLPRSDPTNFSGYPVFTDSSMRGQVQPQALPFLKDTKLEPGSTIDGWLGFSVGDLQQALFTPGAIAGKTWIVEGTVGSHPIRIDLKAVEMELIAETSRPSKLDPSVQVIEIGPRINVINAFKVLELLRAVPPGDRGCVMVLKNKECLFDNLATQQFQQQIFQLINSGNQPVVSYEGPLPMNQGYGYQSFFHNGQFQAVTSETAGVLTVLGRRPETGATLIKHLRDEKGETRAAAAQALTGHLAEANVIKALATVAEDTEAAVRIAAIGALGGGGFPQPGMQGGMGVPQPMRGRGGRVLQPGIRQILDPLIAREVKQPSDGLTGMRKDGSLDTLTLIKAMTDPEARVRLAAAQTAAVFPCNDVRTALIKLLDDADVSVKLVSTGSVGMVEARDGIPKLKILQTDTNPQIKTTAIDALMKMGELSPLEGALAKLDGGTLQESDFVAIGTAREKRAVEPLIRQLKTENNYQINLVARTLGEIGDERAVEPLIQTFVFGNRNYGMEELPRAMGKLGDRRAVEPLRQALQVPNQQIQPQLRAAIFECLLVLKAPKVLDDVAQELQKLVAANRHFEISPILQALGRSRDAKAVTIIEPFLENQQTCMAAAQALWQLGTKPAQTALESKLTAADFQNAQMIILNQQWPRTASSVSFLKKISEGKNENARRAAAQALNNLRAGVGPATAMGAVAPIPIGYIAPSFEVDNAIEDWINDKGMTAADLRGKVQVIYLPDTAGAAPDLPKEGNEFLEKFEKQGLVVFALWKLAGWDWDSAGNAVIIKPDGTSMQEKLAVAALAESRETKYRVGLVSATSGLIEKFGGPAGARVALVDRAGVLQAVRSVDGIDSAPTDFESIIVELLAESPPSASFVRLPRQILPPPDVPKLPRSAVLAYAASGFDPAADSLTIPAHHDTIWSVKFAPDGKTIASTSGDGAARIWDLATGKLRYTLNGHEGNVRHCTFSSDGSKLLTAGFDRTIRVWDPTTGTLEKTLADDAPVYFLDLLDDGQTLISASQDFRVRHWNLTEGKIKTYFSGHSSSTWAAAAKTVDGNRSIIVSGSPDQTVRIWDFPSGEARHTLSGHQSGVNAVAITADGKTVASGGNEVILWNAVTGAEKHRISVPGSFVYDLFFSPDQKTIAVGRNNHTVSLYEVATGNIVRQWNRGGFCVHFSKDGKRLASGCDDRTIRIWNIANSKAATSKPGNSESSD